VTGEAGPRIQAWRQRHDPEQARRLPPHATLCYWAPVVEPERLERQVRHAFDRPVSVRLGGVHEFGNRDHTFYVEVQATASLDAARARLYDGRHLALPARPEWTWHVTCVRYGRGRDLDELRRLASELRLDLPWRIDTIAYLELRGDVYEPVAEWHVGA
jgi:2'-5' RNA ligase